MYQTMELTPNLIISLITFIFTLWVTYATLNNRIKKLEEKMEKIDIEKIWITLTEIQKDIEYIKKNMDK